MKARTTVILWVLLLSLGVMAQSYRPEGRAFVCVNGQNSLTRALYGRGASWPVVTSDRPLFAVGQKSAKRTVQFSIDDVMLDATDYCEARYEDGMRSYMLRHKTWGPKAVVRLKVVPSQTEDLVMIRFLTNGFDDTLHIAVTERANVPRTPQSAFFEDECYVCCTPESTTICDARECSDRFDDLEAAMTQIGGLFEFNTPNPYLNTLGGALQIAAKATRVTLDETLGQRSQTTPEQAWFVTQRIDRKLPHVPLSALRTPLAALPSPLYLLANSNLMPYAEGKHNIVATENMRAALSYFQAGRSEEGYRLMTATVLDQMYEDMSPANFGHLSKYDPTRKEFRCDVAECIEASARTFIEGLFGIQVDKGGRKCTIHPGFPESWDSASIRTPYICYSYRCSGEEAVFDVTQLFDQPRQIVIRQNLGLGRCIDVVGSNEAHQVIRVKMPVRYPNISFSIPGNTAAGAQHKGTDEPIFGDKLYPQNIDRWLTDDLSSLTAAVSATADGSTAGSTPAQAINDSVFRSLIVKDQFLAMGIPFRTKAVGSNIALTSRSKDLPDSISVPLSGKYQRAWLLMAGTTTYRQSRMANGIVVAHYQDGTADTLKLVNPDNWCPIERDYYIDDVSFKAAQPRPYRIALATGQVSRDLGQMLGIQGVSPRLIPGGAAQMLCLPLDNRRKLLSLAIHPLVPDITIGLMAVTLQ